LMHGIFGEDVIAHVTLSFFAEMFEAQDLRPLPHTDGGDEILN
jgi:hypothetical protein